MTSENEVPFFLTVGIGEFAIAAGEGTIITYNLGSCIGVTLFDPPTHTGALLHVKMPDDRKFFLQDLMPEYQPVRRGALTAYADTGLAIVLYEFEKRAIPFSRLEVKLAGGARMYAIAASNLDVGRANRESVRRILARHGIAIRAEDTGGDWARTLSLDLATGAVTVSSTEKGVCPL